MITRDINKVPKRNHNPAASIIEDNLNHFKLSQAEAARRMGVRPSLLNEVLKGKRGVSNDLALRLEAMCGLSAALLVRLQANFDYQKSYHAHNDEIVKQVRKLEPIL